MTQDKDYRREYRAKNGEAIRAKDRARHLRDKEKRNAARRAAHAANPTHLRERDHVRYMADPVVKKLINTKSKYGPEAAQAWVNRHHCAACGDIVSGKKKHVDHDHTRKKGEAGFFRGILCTNCNVALGMLKEDRLRLLGLLSYLDSFDKQK